MHLTFVDLIFRKDEVEDAILVEIRKCTDAVNTNVIEHTAYIHSTAAKKDIDLDKFHEEVKKELQCKHQDNKGKMLRMLFKHLFYFFSTQGCPI